MFYDDNQKGRKEIQYKNTVKKKTSNKIDTIRK